MSRPGERDHPTRGLHHAVSIEPLSPKQVAELLRRRYQHLRRGMRLTAPVEPNVAAEIYRRYRGDLRNVLRLLSRAIQHHAITAPGKSLALDDLVALMAPRYWTELVKRIGDSDATHLATVLRGKPHDAEFRVTDVARALSLSQPAATKFVQRVVKARVIERTHAEGKSVFYGVREGDLTVALALR